MEEEGMLVVVVKAECRYRKPARYDDLLTVRTTIRRVTLAKIEHDYVILRDAEQLATGHVTMAMLDRHGRVLKIPNWLQTGADSS
jgi:acyl-CoA thioester hydrolase